MDSGEVHRGKIRPATRQSLREWLDEFTEPLSGKQIAIALEATTGWRYVIEELRGELASSLTWPSRRRPSPCRAARSGPRPILQGPTTAGHLRDLMVIDRLPESWIPPHHIQEIRTLMRLRHSLIEERTTHKRSASMPSSSTTAILSRRRIWGLY